MVSASLSRKKADDDVACAGRRKRLQYSWMCFRSLEASMLWYYGECPPLTFSQKDDSMDECFRELCAAASKQHVGSSMLRTLDVLYLRLDSPSLPSTYISRKDLSETKIQSLNLHRVCASVTLKNATNIIMRAVKKLGEIFNVFPPPLQSKIHEKRLDAASSSSLLISP